ncbi:MAG: isoprenylcysteine carboxylmethyltransferase family protein [Bryobacteraceae bacterium]
MSFTVQSLTYGLWAALAAVWIVGTLRNKQTVRSQPAASRALHSGLLLLGILLIFAPQPDLGSLSSRFVPRNGIAEECGLVLTALGVGFAIWARVFLGGNWSATVTVKERHTLVRSGPYRIVRHPIYTGLLLAMLGTAISVGELRALLGWLPVLVGFWYKSRLEESYLLAEFGEQYVVYREHTKSLIPFVF